MGFQPAKLANVRLMAKSNFLRDADQTKSEEAVS
jgi:hypothetical protein